MDLKALFVFSFESHSKEAKPARKSTFKLKCVVGESECFTAGFM